MAAIAPAIRPSTSATHTTSALAVVSASVVVLGGAWVLLHQDSFFKFVMPQLRTEWRRATVYALRWREDWPPADLWTRVADGLFLALRWSMIAPWYELVGVEEAGAG